jgi:peptidoglycan/xylan/chitin deacetylase (PgdA/CDA1 family)
MEFSKMQITLTFDNGPTAETTPQVLEILSRRGVLADFFVLGKQMMDPDLYKLAETARTLGHRIGNHTFSHSIPFGDLANQEEAIAEISRTQLLIGDLAGTELLFRPFGAGGEPNRRLLNRAAVEHLETNNYTLALWTSIPRDWEDVAGWPETALAQCAAEPWSVVVLHDGPTGAMSHLDRFIGTLMDRGASFRQDFPLKATPLLRGRRVGDLESLTANLRSNA